MYCLASISGCDVVWGTNQERGGVERGQWHWMKNLRLFQGFQLFIPQNTDTVQENLLPGVKLEHLYSTQDLVHQFDPSVHEVHLNLLANKKKTLEWNNIFLSRVSLALTCSLLLTLAMNALRGKITTTVTIPASADGPRSYQSVKLELLFTGTTGRLWSLTTFTSRA